MSNYAHPEALVSTQWVADHLDDPNVRLVEGVWRNSTLYSMLAYEKGHIPGAMAWDFAEDIQDPDRDDILDKEGMEALLSRLGITPETIIVVYSGGSNLIAAYAFWQLKISGHRNTRLLDGARQKWLDEERPTSSEVPLIEPTIYQAQDPNWSLRADKDDVLQSIGQEGHLSVDTRPIEMYNGLDNAGAAHAGHIPGAVNLAAQKDINEDGSLNNWLLPTVNPDGTFKSAAELQTIVESLGITSDQEIITYCVGGGLSSHAWFVLTQLLGFPNVHEYDRSWREWGNVDGVPIE